MEGWTPHVEGAEQGMLLDTSLAEVVAEQLRTTNKLCFEDFFPDFFMALTKGGDDEGRRPLPAGSSEQFDGEKARAFPTVPVRPDAPGGAGAQGTLPYRGDGRFPPSAAPPGERSGRLVDMEGSS